MKAKKQAEKVVNVAWLGEAAKSYQVCLKMIFVDLEELKDPRVANILRHYNAHFLADGRLALELPRYRPASRRK